MPRTYIIRPTVVANPSRILRGRVRSNSPFSSFSCLTSLLSGVTLRVKPRWTTHAEADITGGTTLHLFYAWSSGPHDYPLLLSFSATYASRFDARKPFCHSQLRRHDYPSTVLPVSFDLTVFASYTTPGDPFKMRSSIYTYHWRLSGVLMYRILFSQPRRELRWDPSTAEPSTLCSQKRHSLVLQPTVLEDLPDKYYKYYNCNHIRVPFILQLFHSHLQQWQQTYVDTLSL